MVGVDLTALNLFVTSQCNARCQHCFYWRSLNKKDDLTFAQIKKLNRSLGKVKVLNLSGGEPFLRKDLVKICQLFLDNNQTKTISIPTNGLLPETIAKETEKILKTAKGKRIIVCLSLDGTEKLHDQMRGVKGNFKKVAKSYEKLAKLKKKYPHFSLRIGTVVLKKNYQDLFKLFDQASKIFSEVDALTLSLVRPEKFGDKYELPSYKKLKELFLYKQKVVDKKQPFWRRLLERMVFIATQKAIRQQKQVVPCQAGKKEAVVFANGELGLCEMLLSVGNIKKKGFISVWQSRKAEQQRKIINNNHCFCTHEGFLFHSLSANPLSWPRLVIEALFFK